MSYIESYKDQPYLLAPSIEDMIPEDHICFLVEALIDSQDYSGFDIKYSGAGHPAYHPRILLKVLVMGIIDRIRSSRKLARNAKENVVYLYLSEKLSPDFRTISDFRKDNLGLIKEVFKQTVVFGKREKLIDISHLSTDGTKIKANAANKRALTKEEVGVLLNFVNGELEEWANEDEREDKAYGDLRGSDQLPKRSKRVIREAARYYVKEAREKGHGYKEELENKLNEARQEIEVHGLDKVSVTDPQSRFMKSKKGHIELSYSPQITVDNKGFILANEVCQDANDVKQLVPQVIETEKNLGGIPEGTAWSFDAGYSEGGNIKFLMDKKIDGYIPDLSEHKGVVGYNKGQFTYEAGSDEYRCPQGKTVRFTEQYFDQKKQKTIRVYKGESCLSCEKQKECTRQKDGIRRLRVHPHETERNVMAAKMQTAGAKVLYKQRKQTVEPAFGDIKENKGVRAFLLRGIQGVRTEFNLACIARNVTKIWQYYKEKEMEFSMNVG